MNNRVVITGLGVVSPNGVGIADFRDAIKSGVSGIRYEAELAALQFSCCIAGRPVVSEDLQKQYFDELELKQLKSSGIIYGVIAGMQAWADAQLPLPATNTPDWDSGTIFGAGTSGVDKFREAIYKVDDLQVRRLGSTAVTQTMASGISAFLGGKLGLGNQVTTNSSACTTGAESILLAYERIKYGHAKRMLAGSTSESGPYIWGGFDAMKVSTFKYNEQPAAGSRPLSATASGIVPGSGAGALLLESLDSALARNAPIYAEVLGGNINSGGQRNGGSMTAPNPDAVQRCISAALQQAGVSGAEVDLINGHLTATGKDAEEVQNWCVALGRSGKDFPWLNALKSMVGHCLSASGSMAWMAVAPILVVLAVVLELFAVPQADWGRRLVGSNMMICMTFIPLIGVGPLAVFLGMLRYGAPTRPVLAGAAAGLLAGGLAATFYAAHCFDDSPLFVATWYTIAIAFLTLLGAIGGRLFVRW